MIQLLRPILQFPKGRIKENCSLPIFSILFSAWGMHATISSYPIKNPFNAKGKTYISFPKEQHLPLLIHTRQSRL
jgi:hypothetical protein